MRIPTWTGGDGAAQAPVQHTRIGNPGGAVAEATDRLGGIVSGLAQHEMQRIGQEAEDLAVAKSATALTQHELALSDTERAVQERVDRGEISYLDAEKEFDDEAGRLDPPDLRAVDQAHKERLHNAMLQTQARVKDRMVGFVDQARKADVRGQVTMQIDAIRKLAATPGEDLEKQVNRLDTAVAPLAARAGLSPRVIQDAKDAIYTDHAVRRAIVAREDLPALQQLEEDLTSDKGFYASRLDPDKRNAILQSVVAHRIRLEAKIEGTTAKREAKAERQANWLRDQVATGIPLDPVKVLEVRADAAGTEHEQDVAAAIEQIGEVARFRTLPFAEQSRALTEMRATLNNTPSDDPKRDLARLNTLQQAFESSQKLAAESPMEFWQIQSGEPVPPIDLAKVAALAAANPGAAPQILEGELVGRYNTLRAMRRQYGPQIALNPWRPEEAEAVRLLVKDAPTDRAKLTILGVIAGAAPDVQAYRDTLAPIAQDDRIAYLAGVEQYLGHKPKGIDLAATLLKGQRALKDQTIDLPSPEQLRRSFDAGVGNALPLDSEARSDAFERYRHIYAGRADTVTKRATKTGTVDADLDREALELATGGITVYAGKKTVLPYGMEASDFSDRMRGEVQRIAGASGYPASTLEDMPLMPIPGHEGQYFLVNTGTGALQLDPKTGKPIIARAR